MLTDFNHMPSEIIEKIVSFLHPIRDRLTVLSLNKRIAAIAECYFNRQDSTYHFLVEALQVKRGAEEGALKLLKDPKINVDKDHWSADEASPLILASQKGYVKVVIELLKRQETNLGKEGGNALIAACEKGQKEVVKELLKDRRIDPTMYNNKALLQADQGGYIEIVNILLDDKRVLERFRKCPKPLIINESIWNKFSIIAYLNTMYSL